MLAQSGDSSEVKSLAGHPAGPMCTNQRRHRHACHIHPTRPTDTSWQQTPGQFQSSALPTWPTCTPACCPPWLDWAAYGGAVRGGRGGGRGEGGAGPRAGFPNHEERQQAGELGTDAGCDAEADDRRQVFLPALRCGSDREIQSCAHWAHRRQTRMELPADAVRWVSGPPQACAWLCVVAHGATSRLT